MRLGRLARTEVHRGDAATGQTRDVGPRLLRRDGQPLGPHPRSEKRVVQVHVPGGCRVADLHLSARADQRVQLVQRVVDRATGREPAVQVQLEAIRYHVGRIRRARLRGGDHLEESEVADPHLPAVAIPQTLEKRNRAGDGAFALPRSGAVRAAPSDGDPGVHDAHAPHLQPPVRRFEHEREVQIRDDTTFQHGLQPVLVERPFLPVVEQEDRAGGPELAPLVEQAEHHRHTALHVARAAAVNPAVHDLVPLVPRTPHRVEVSDQRDGWTLIRGRRHAYDGVPDPVQLRLRRCRPTPALHLIRDPFLGPRLTRDPAQLQRRPSQLVGNGHGILEC
jgi:hypothetical protein